MRIEKPRNDRLDHLIQKLAQDQPVEPEYWTSKETARHLCVHIATIKRWMKQGLPHRRIVGGRKILFRPSEVRAWVDEHAEPNAEPSNGKRT